MVSLLIFLLRLSKKGLKKPKNQIIQIFFKTF